jgi:uncharacterized protein (DUF1501 family)
MATSSYGLLGALQRAQAGTLDCSSDYRALVCVFLDGGADSYNMVVPMASGTGNPSTDYDTYLQSRSNMAEAQGSLLSVGDGTFGLNPAFSALQPLYQSGNMAVVPNVGSLIEPVTKAQWEAGSVSLPPQLFSHSDQQIQWQTAHADSLLNQGWCGRVADLMHATCNGGSSLSMNISVVGSNVLQVGDSSVPYSIGTNGPIGLGLGYDPLDERRAVVEALMASNSHLFESEYGAVKQRALDNFDLINASLTNLGDLETAFPQFGTTPSSLGRQLRIVAAMIAIRTALGANRQTFVVRIGGWDTHDNQIADLPARMQDLSDSMAAFYDATAQSPDINSSEVTTFSFSEFSRTLNSNGNGTDHGWGGHQIVLGDAVSGGQIYGPMPDLTIDGPEDTGRGRIIPTMSVEQYVAPLAGWFGVPSGDLGTVFPNLGNFPAPPSFML